MGIGLALGKAQLSSKVVWVGVELEANVWEMIANIPQEQLADLDTFIQEMLNSNVVSIKALRSLAGKGNNVAALLYTWRPFLNQLWAALSANETHSTNAPAQCVWAKHIFSSLSWLLAFIRRQKGTISRTFSYHSCFGLTAPVTITTDASIWGCGGWISMNGKAIAYFSETVSKDDEIILELKRGEPKSQQGFEAIALLIVVRLWLPFC